jgi:hypothetical protein
VSENESHQGSLPSPVLLKALGAVIALEAVAAIVLAGFLILELLTAPTASMGSAIAIVVIAILAAIWLVALTIATLRGRPWIRGAIVTWQLIQILCAIGCFQGILAVPEVGWALLVPAVIALVLLFSPSVVAVTRRT